MGTIRKESTFSTIAAYLGAVLGMVNKVILLPRFFELDEIGLVNITVTTAMTLAQLSLLGFGAITIKYFPYFKDKENNHNGFLGLGMGFGLSGFVLLTATFFIFKDPILAHLSQGSALLVEYYYIIFIIGFFFLIFNVYTYYLQVLFKAYVVNLIRDVGLRLGVTVSIFLYAANLVDFETFVVVFTAINCSISLFIILYTSYLKQNFLRLKMRPDLRKRIREIMGYGLIAFLGATSYSVIMTVDAIMVADLVSLEAAGIYTTVLYVTAFILYPYRALTHISSPKIGEFWKNNDVAGIQALYQRTSFLGLLFGLVLFLGVWINRKNFVYLTTDEFAGAETILLFLGLHKLLDSVSGLNSYILVTSKIFRYDLIFNLILMVMAVVLNIWLIGIYGMDGAAMATLIAGGFFQVIRMVFLWFAYKLNPLSLKMLPLLAFGGIAFGVDYLIPVIEPFWVDIIIRSGSFAVIYVGLVYVSKVSEDVNRMIHLVKSKILP